MTGSIYASKTNHLLMKNHQARPTGLNAAPETHATNSSSHNRKRYYHGCGKGWPAPPKAEDPLNRGSSKGGNLTQKRQPLARKAPNFKNKGKTTIQLDSIELDMCYRYGSRDHWSHICRATPEAIAKYHSRRESNFTHVAILKATTTTLEVSNFQEAFAPMEE
ncbi:uncharacterized protein LOC125472285 [Pyrus x bretschneideri]|uniref:uncharacterized protein LOC125472285 n=1 Tax=Pyrus x bretschneideri TaxID=225117 RepID=UPI00202FCE34|nr:uncharacterized protein LOC125472285 [Pyrus x bretschneideri]